MTEKIRWVSLKIIFKEVSIIKDRINKVGFTKQYI